MTARRNPTSRRWTLTFVADITENHPPCCQAPCFPNQGSPEQAHRFRSRGCQGGCWVSRYNFASRRWGIELGEDTRWTNRLGIGYLCWCGHLCLYSLSILPDEEELYQIYVKIFTDHRFSQPRPLRAPSHRVAPQLQGQACP